MTRFPLRSAIIQNVPASHHHVVYIDGVARNLDRSRFEPLVFLQRGDDISANYPPINYDLHLFPGSTYSPIGQLKFMAASWWALEAEYDPAIIHCINPFSSLLPAILSRRRGRSLPRIIYDMRGLWVEFGVHAGYFPEPLGALIDRLDVQLMRRCDKILAISAKLKEVLIDKGIVEEQIEIVPGGVDLDRFQESIPFDYATLGWDGTILGYVASISTARESESVIKAFDIVQRRIRRDVFLAMIGPVYEPDYYCELVSSLGLEDKVKFFGQVPHSRIPGLMKGLDVAVSYYPDEEAAFDQVRVPYKVLEYLSAGVPVVLTNQHCHRALVQDQHDAYLVEPDTESLAQGMLRLCQDAGLARRLSTNAMVSAREFSFENVARKVACIYESLI